MTPPVSGGNQNVEILQKKSIKKSIGSTSDRTKRDSSFLDATARALNELKQHKHEHLHGIEVTETIKKNRKMNREKARKRHAKVMRSLEMLVANGEKEKLDSESPLHGENIIDDHQSDRKTYMSKVDLGKENNKDHDMSKVDANGGLIAVPTSSDELLRRTVPQLNVQHAQNAQHAQNLVETSTKLGATTKLGTKVGSHTHMKFNPAIIKAKIGSIGGSMYTTEGSDWQFFCILVFFL